MYSLQPLLLCSKLVNQRITRVTCPEGEQYVEVRAPFGLLERVKADPASLPFRMLVGRLQNCGFCQSHLAEVFAIDPKSVRRYARALQDGSPEAIQRISVTRAGKEKITPEISRFAIMRYHELRKTTKDYRQVILTQVEKIFEVKVSGESLRLLWKDDDKR